jgi:hypothetical protein
MPLLFYNPPKLCRYELLRDSNARDLKPLIAEAKTKILSIGNDCRHCTCPAKAQITALTLKMRDTAKDALPSHHPIIPSKKTADVMFITFAVADPF